MKLRIEKRVTVECYAGYKGDERPVSFLLEGRTCLVQEVTDRWYDPESSYFRVLGSDGASYLLRHDLNTDLWTLLESF